MWMTLRAPLEFLDDLNKKKKKDRKIKRIGKVIY